VGFLGVWLGYWDGGAKRGCDASAASPGVASIGSADRRNNRNNRTRSSFNSLAAEGHVVRHCSFVYEDDAGDSQAVL
jgi:hypothetical protein